MAILTNRYHKRFHRGPITRRGKHFHAIMTSCHGPLARYVKLRVAHAPGMPGTFSPTTAFSDTDMHHGTCVTHVPWCMSGSLTSGFLWSRWRGKRARHSRRMRNPRFYVSGKRPMIGQSVGSFYDWRYLFHMCVYITLMKDFVITWKARNITCHVVINALFLDLCQSGNN